MHFWIFLSVVVKSRVNLWENGENNNNWASGILHPGPSESDVYSNVIQEAQSNCLLHTAHLLILLDTPLHGNNARAAKYAVYYASVVTHTVFENIKWLRSALCRNRNVAVPSLACLFPDLNSPISVFYVGIIEQVPAGKVALSIGFLTL